MFRTATAEGARAMADLEAPDNDVVEQELPEEPTEPTLGVDVPEADAFEQAQDLAVSPTAPTRPRLGDGIPEADALEQSHPVAFDEDDDYR
jgi:hypothetical protein